MERQPTKQELRKFHGYTPKPKKPIQEFQLIDRFGNIIIRGNYALCQWKKNQLGGSLTIKTIR